MAVLFYNRNLNCPCKIFGYAEMQMDEKKLYPFLSAAAALFWNRCERRRRIADFFFCWDIHEA